MFCKKCGRDIGDCRFCPMCGTDIAEEWNRGGTPPFTTAYGGSHAHKKKSRRTAALLSFIYPGLGHIYLGRITRGLLFMLSPVFIAFFAGWVFSITDSMAVTGGEELIPLAAFFLILVMWASGICSAYADAGFYNSELEHTGNPPW